MIARRVVQWLRALAQPTTYLGVAMIGVIWSGAYFLAHEEHDRAYEAALQQGKNLSRVFEEYIARVIRGTDSALLTLRESYARDPQNFNIAREVNDAKFQNDLTVQFAIAGSDGIVTHSSQEMAAASVNVSDRRYFAFHANSTADELYIGEPVIGRVSGKHSIQVTRRIAASDGSFGGVILASLDIDRLEKFYNSVDIGRAGVIALTGFDGIVRARSGHTPMAKSFVGKSSANTRLFQLYRQFPSGSYWNTQNPQSRFEGISRLVSYRVLDGIPLIAVVGLAESDIFAKANLTARQYYQIAFVLTGFILVAIGFGAVRQMKLFVAATALEHSKLSLEQTNALFHTALENMTHGLCMFDRDQRLVICNTRYTQMYGLSAEQTKPGTTLRSILEARVMAGVSPEDHAKYVESHLKNAAMSESGHVINELRDGRIVAVSRDPLPGGGWVGVHQDITEQKKTEAQIVHLARHDVLTGLANRTVLREKIEEALMRLQRGGERFTIFMLDLDLFKVVNDSLGHPIGDELLKAVARRLLACTRNIDTVARLGGDEFAILAMIDGDQHETSIVMANRFLEAVSAPYDLYTHHLDIGTSIGIAFAPEHGADVDQLIKRADLALYKAKSEGRNACRLFEAAMETEASARRALEIDMRNGLMQDEFELHYHPIIDIQTKEVASVEALVRWRHPQRGMIPPNDFIPLAEETGLINHLGAWVLQKACSDAASWPSHIKVSVNLSPVQFRREGLVKMISSAIAESGLPPERLELEITESILMQESEENIATLHQLRSLGAAIVLDDFGTGYSSLSYLRIFPFDMIKIDRSFVHELSKDSDCAAIVSAIAGLGRSLRVGTVAEGVETEDQLTLIRAAGCTHAQGFLFGRPCPVAELDFTRLISRQRKGAGAF